MGVQDETSYCYDRRGNVTAKQEGIDASAPWITYSYTLADRLASITYPSGAIVSYLPRNAAGQVTTITYQANAQAPAQTLINNVNYLPFGPLTKLFFANGRTLTKSYDSNYAISSVASSNSNGLTIGASVDVIGNLTSASTTINANPPTLSYHYDPLYRLANVVQGASTNEAYTYDRTGDRLTASTTASGSLSYTYNPGTHQLASVGGQGRSTDASGNTTSLPYANFAVTAAYEYNARGERVTKTISSLTNSFVYNESGQLLGEYGGSLIQEYVYLDGVPVGIVSNASGTTQLYYVETDQLGSPRYVIQPGATTANDSVVWKWDYFGSAFGTNAPNPQTLTVNLRFPGQYFDAETGLSYNYFRDYEPGTGRYVESDPLGLDGGLATYAYVYSDPLDLTDKFGLSPQICCRLLGDPRHRGAADFIAGVILRQRHCYVDNDGDAYSLAPKDGLGYKYPVNGYEEDTNDVTNRNPSTKCKECKKKECASGDPGECLKKAYDDYPTYSKYFFLGQNSNAFTGTLFRSCCAGNGSGLGSAPGFNHKPATAVQ